MRKPDRRLWIVGLASWILGVQIGCSASETDNTVGAMGATGGKSAGTGGTASVTGGKGSTGGQTPAGISTSCYQGGPCSGYSTCKAGPLTCACNANKYSCT